MTTGDSGVWTELEDAMADLRVAHASLELTSQEKLHLCVTRMAVKYGVIEPAPRPTLTLIRGGGDAS